MTQALIGHTGFVGATLAAVEPYEGVYNSKTIEDIHGRSFDRIVCAGVNAVKWKANADPAGDLAGIESLKQALEQVKAQTFVLISTVDVYPSPHGVDEATPLDRHAGQAYGRHRLEFEDWTRSRFPNVLVVRLPALFGPGLKKNILFDMLNRHQVDRINGTSSFQWYDLAWLPDHLAVAEKAGLDLVNLSVEPLSTQEIQAAIFPDLTVAFEPDSAAHYDVGTVHADLFGREGRYLKTAGESLSAMKDFVATAGRQA